MSLVLSEELFSSAIFYQDLMFRVINCGIGTLFALCVVTCLFCYPFYKIEAGTFLSLRQAMLLVDSYLMCSFQVAIS